MVSEEERVSYLEGKIDSLATKADLAQLESRLSQLESRLMWRLIMSQVLTLGTMAGIVAALVVALS